MANEIPASTASNPQPSSPANPETSTSHTIPTTLLLPPNYPPLENPLDVRVPLHFMHKCSVDEFCDLKDPLVAFVRDFNRDSEITLEPPSFFWYITYGRFHQHAKYVLVPKSSSGYWEDRKSVDERWYPAMIMVGIEEDDMHRWKEIEELLRPRLEGVCERFGVEVPVVRYWFDIPEPTWLILD